MPVRRIFTHLSGREQRFLSDVLRTETVGGVLLLLGATAGLVWANSPWSDTYRELLGTRLGPSALHLDLTVQAWAADGLLAVFFFVAGLELKRELVAGELRDPARAAVPVVAAVAGVVLPAAVYLVVSASEPGAASGWAVPVATDIAVALAALAVLGTHLPAALRSFLLTLAVVDDLLAVVIIAVAYTDELHPWPLLAAVVPLVAFAVLARRGGPWWLLPVPALLTWALVHAGGVHATVAGVALAFTVPALAHPGAGHPGPAPSGTTGHDAIGHDAIGHSPAERYEHALRPVSAGVAVPVFALFAAGVGLSPGDLVAAVRDPIVLAVVAGLVVGKPVGVLGGTYLMARFTRAELDPDLSWADITGVSLLSGIGFTVSLLIGELAFGAAGERSDHVRLAVLAGTLLAAVAAALVLTRRNRHYRALETAEAVTVPAGSTPG